MASRAFPTRRRNYGNNHGYFLDGQPIKGRGVTALLGQGFPKPALVGWAANEAATAALDEQDVWVPLAQRDRSAAHKYLADARNRDRDAAAKRGTEVHRLAERLQAGEEIEVPPELVGHVDSYLQFREDWQPADEIIEGVVVNRKWRYMGTFDSIATLEGFPGGDRVLYDIKTSRSGVFPETALQLAAYRFAETFLPEPNGGEELPMPQVDACAALHLRADGYDLVPVRADEEVWRLFLYVTQVAEFMGPDWKEPGWSKDVIGEPLMPPERVDA